MPTLPLTPDQLLTTTRSVRKRLDLTRDVPIDLVRECLEVALQAPSGSNKQGWHWMVITDENSRRVIGNYPPGRGVLPEVIGLRRDAVRR
jgi:nitroreductase